jgi:hypothetical protein
MLERKMTTLLKQMKNRKERENGNLRMGKHHNQHQKQKCQWRCSMPEYKRHQEESVN